MFKVVQKLGKFVVKMYHKEASRLTEKQGRLFVAAQQTEAQALNLQLQAQEHRRLALDAGSEAKAVSDKAKALEGLF